MIASYYFQRHNEGNQSPHASLIGEDNIDLNQWAICPDFQCKESKSIIGNAHWEFIIALVHNITSGLLLLTKTKNLKNRKVALATN